MAQAMSSQTCKFTRALRARKHKQLMIHIQGETSECSDRLHRAVEEHKDEVRTGLAITTGVGGVTTALLNVRKIARLLRNIRWRWPPRGPPPLP